MALLHSPAVTSGHARTARRAAALARLLLALGIAGAGWGILYAANGATQAPATVKVPVSVAASTPGSGGGWGNTRVTLQGATPPTDAWFAPARPDGLAFGAGPDGTLTLAAWDSTVLEQVLSRGGEVVGGLGMLVVALALRPVLLSLAGGRPFAHGNARRLSVAAAVVAVAGLLAPVPPQLAAALVLQRLALDGPVRIDPASALNPESLLVAAVLLALAAAFRIGERQARDLDGLV